MNIYQGEDVPFELKLFKDKEKTQAVNLDNLAGLYLYFFTDKCSVIKFCKGSKSGYQTLTKVDAFTYKCNLESSQTKTLTPGTLFVEVNIAETNTDITDGKFNLITRSVVCQLLNSSIKYES